MNPNFIHEKLRVLSTAATLNPDAPWYVVHFTFEEWEAHADDLHRMEKEDYHDGQGLRAGCVIHYRGWVLDALRGIANGALIAGVWYDHRERFVTIRIENIRK